MLLLGLPLLFLSLFPSPLCAQGSDADALLALKAAVDPSDRLPFVPASSYCRWTGVSCSVDGRVVSLVLASAGLAGRLPGGAFARLDHLRVLSLKNNSLAGRFPDSLLDLSALRSLDLSHNRLAGPLPPALAEMDGLHALLLEENFFNGSIPAFNQSSLKSFNVSGNDLSGAVPATDVLASFDPSVFAGNPGLCGGLVRKECASNSFFPRGVSPSTGAAPSPASTAASDGGTGLPRSASPSRGLHKTTLVAIGFLIGAIVLIFVFSVSLVIRRKKIPGQQQGTEMTEKNAVTNGVADISEINAKSYTDEDIESTGIGAVDPATELALAISEERVKRMGKNGSLVFCAEEPFCNLEQLMRASAEMLGRGSLGSTYKAVLDGRLAVTVKRLDKKKLGTAAKEGFEHDIQRVGSLRHPNLVPLRAYFQANEERLIVYDYQPNGSLYSLIHGSKFTRSKPLHWTSCLKIADDVVQGLAYIHQTCHLVHGNIKSSNVLLGSDFEACLTDNCLTFLLQPLDDHSDPGYRAPEIESNQQHTPSSDIYAFGVLLLELLTGKPPSEHPILIPSDIPVWVQSVRDDRDIEEHLMMIIGIASACTCSSPEFRPATLQVLKMIQEVKEAETQENDFVQ
ncbi:probable inactive receptor kinase At5g67200 [Zingiber officinale]|uniref:Protein kinase domain-containing protein n=1 Tax=Zingiber officinale TaxID=94328 RepID=A0A8J5EAP0_ZINOF|nr:probable inactive receptor kinase At5g67200 [Zingiber officinale]KAG6469305.1 hypothetical protein ZIOFF_074013 [Zingiber officinale]